MMRTPPFRQIDFSNRESEIVSTVKLKAIEFHTIKRRNGEFNIFYV